MRKTDIARIKSHVTNSRDDIRAPFARKATKIARRTSYIATVNDPRFLVDPTGNRRFWTISIVSINLKHGLDMQQVWAEVAHYMLAGEATWLSDEESELLNESNKEYERIDPLEELFDSHFTIEGTGNALELTCTEILLAMHCKTDSKSLATQFAYMLRKKGLIPIRRRTYRLYKK
jgi:putative DNA primase/helicase